VEVLRLSCGHWFVGRAGGAGRRGSGSRVAASGHPSARVRQGKSPSWPGGNLGGDAGCLGLLGRGWRHVSFSAAGFRISPHCISISAVCRVRSCRLYRRWEPFVPCHRRRRRSPGRSCRWPRRWPRRAGGSGRRTCCGLRASSPPGHPLGRMRAGGLLHPSVTGAVHPVRAGAVRLGARTLRTNLRFIGRRVVAQLHPQDLPLARERAKAPCKPGRIDGFLRWRTPSPRWSGGCGGGAGLPGRGAGLIRGDCAMCAASTSRAASGGVVVAVRARGRARCRCWPAITPGCWPRLVRRERADCGGADPGRREHHEPADHALDGGTGLPRLDTAGCGDLAGRLRGPAGDWPTSCTRPGSAAPSAGDLIAGLEPAGEAGAVRLLGGVPPAYPVAVFEGSSTLRRRAAIEAMLPTGVRPGS